MENRTGTLPKLEPGSRREALAAMLLFLLIALIPLPDLLNAQQLGILEWVRNGLGLALVTVFVIGLIKGLPRWSLPYTGMIGITLSWSLAHRGTVMGLDTRAGVLDPLLGWADRLFLTVVRRSNPWIVRAVLGAGWDWMVLLGLTALGVLIVAVLRPLRPLYARIRDDWTLLSFGLYGATVMAVLYTFEDLPVARYPNWGHVGASASLLILAAGAWLYIRSGRASREATAGRRALALFAAMALAMIVGATGREIVYSSPNWPYTDALSAAIFWDWVMVVVLAPALLTLLPRRTRSAQAG